MASASSKLKRIKFTFSPTQAGRIHYLTADDVSVLLSRLPEELWHWLRAVHFNDRSRGRRVAGYVNRARREIAICAFPASVSCAPYTARRIGTSPHTFGAQRGRQWPSLAVRRFLLYDTFLHELGHLQVVDPSARNVRRRFASESWAQKFANDWRRRLWSKPFDHPDPVHNSPHYETLQEADVTSRPNAAGLWKRWAEARHADDFAEVVDIARRLIDVEPGDWVAWASLGTALEELADYEGAKAALKTALEYVPAKTRFRITLAMADVYRVERDFKRAARWSRMTIQLNPGYAGGYTYLGASYVGQGKIVQAEKTHRLAIACKEGCIDEAYLCLGQVLQWQGKLQEARDCFKKAIEIDPHYATAKKLLIGVEKRLRECKNRPVETANNTDG
jgi:hypothetical protein